jgi:hypothetical protein
MSSNTNVFCLKFLAHCLHNIGLLYDMQKEHERSLPHYEEALVIKNALAGFDTKGSLVATDGSDQLVLRCLDDDAELPAITKATLSAAMTHVRMASVYAKVCCVVTSDLICHQYGLISSSLF